MRRFPPYMIVAVCGILCLSAGMVIITADNEPAAPSGEALITLTPADPNAGTAGEGSLAVEQPTDVLSVVLPTLADLSQAADQSAVPSGVTEPLPETPVAAVANDTALTPAVEPISTIPPVEILPTLVIPTLQPATESQVVQPVVVEQVIVSANTQVMGQIHIPLRADFTGIAVAIVLPDGQVLQTQTDAAGNFAFANLGAGTYQINAGLAGYLSTQTTFALTAGQVLLLPTISLIGGDTNADNRIDLSDAALIAANFDGQTPVGGADLNRDGIVDIRDLTAIGAFFGQIGPVSWQP